MLSYVSRINKPINITATYSILRPWLVIPYILFDSKRYSSSKVFNIINLTIVL